MRIDHIAVWTKDLERLKAFYEKYFHCSPGSKYINALKNFQSYFLSFTDGSRLEIMQMPDIPENLNNPMDQFLGIIHFAIKVNGKDQVDMLTRQLQDDGYPVISEPRITGDGYYESVIFDPDKNRIEIVG